MIRVYLIATLDSSNTCMFVGGISSLRVRISSGFETLIKFLLTFVKAKSISHSTHNTTIRDVFQNVVRVVHNVIRLIDYYDGRRHGQTLFGSIARIGYGDKFLLTLVKAKSISHSTHNTTISDVF